jgi:signal transduction histidine kinase/CheY-like chemotaxis protein
MSKLKFHNRLTIRQKIISIILIVTIISIITGFAIEIYNSIKTSRNELKDNITLDAKLISDYLVPTFLFDDRAGAKEILQKLQNIPSVRYGATYDLKEKLYAEYRSTSSADSVKSLIEILKTAENEKEILIHEKVKWKDEILGTVLLVASTDIIRQKTRDHIESVVLILIITILIAILIAFLLERIISGPILRLAAVTRKIQNSLDYSVRVKKEAWDETGVLYDGFNDMLQRIEAQKMERDNAQQKLNEERANLEIRVLERTKELNTAKEKAEESDKLKSAFLSNMSHEIRTPLNAILGCSSLIQETSPTPDELKEYYKMMESSGTDLLNLIDDILDISSIEANQIKINFKDTSVNGLAEEVFKTFKMSLFAENPHNPVTPVFVVPPEKEDYILNTDPLRLKQILINILNNSIKFTSEGTIEFCYFPNEAKNEMVFSVKDSGIGIAKEQQTKIFERFTKVADLKTKHYRGTGLGLSIALKLTKLLNGDIHVESELNIGTAFYISFPMTRALSSEVVKEQKPRDESLAFLSGKVILVAEDVEYNFKYFEIILTKNKDVKIIWAKNGREAVDLCKNNPEINIVLMDIQLPEMNGLDATRLIKSANPDLPVIAQTAYATALNTRECYAAGCMDVLIKPINKTNLLLLLKKYIT